MRKIRIFSIIVFLTAITVFGLYKNREMKLMDHEGPVIAMKKDRVKVSCADGEDKLLAGIKAKDSKDGDVTDSLIVESMTNFIKKGKRKMTVVAFDSDNNATKATRLVGYSDYESPKFSLEAPLKFPIKTSEIMGTLTVQDMLDGDLTGNIKMSSEYYVQADEAGDYPMVFTVANSAGDVVKLPVTIQIYDPSKEGQNPKIELSEYMIYVEPGTVVNPWEYVEQITIGNIKYIKAEDGILYDPNPGPNQMRTAISPVDVEITDNADYNTPGVYEITYQLTDNSGKESRTGTVRLIVVVSE